MSSWYSLDLGDGVEAAAPSLRVQEIFENFFSANGLPKDMAVFIEYNLDNHTTTLYVSPAAKSVALAIGASRCEKPSPEQLTMLHGRQDGWPVIFPGLERR